MEDREAADSLRDILAKSPPKSPPKTTLHSPPTTPSGLAATPSTPTPATPRLIPRPNPILEYPPVDVPGSSLKSATVFTHTGSPAQYHSRTRSSGATPSPSPKSISSRLTPQKAQAKNHGGGFFKSLHGRSASGTSDDNAKYTTATLENGQSPPRLPVSIRTRRLSSTRSPSVGGSPKIRSGLASIFHSGSPTKKADGSALVRSGSRDSLNVKDSEYEHRKYRAAKLRKSSMSSTDTPSPRSLMKDRRKVSWVDETTNANAKSQSPSSDLQKDDKQTVHGFKAQAQKDTSSATSGSTLSLNSRSASSNNSALSVLDLDTPPAQVPTPHAATLATSRNLAPSKGNNLWDPSDDEWADVDATNVVSTFKASFRDPSTSSPRKSGALSRFTNTITPYLPSSSSPLLRSAEKLRQEEEYRDKLDVLQNTYFSNPNGDLHDEVLADVFLAGSKYFVASAKSPRSMHVVHLEGYFTTSNALLQEAKPRLCDAVATVLSHTNKECLEAFLDPNVNEFAYRRELDKNKAGTVLIVRREGNTVFAGAYRNLGFRLQWTLYIKSLISITGLWHEAYATLKPGFTPIVNGVPAWDQFDTDDDRPKPELSKEGLPRKIELSNPKKKQEHDDLGPENPKFMLYQSRLLAKYLLADIWARFDALCECRATWEADGVVTNVRLRRALVGFGEDGESEE